MHVFIRAGPKIDITVFDALRRKFQCATVQLDFQMPIRFGLEYVAEDGSYQRPVIVHRCGPIGERTESPCM